MGLELVYDLSSVWITAALYLAGGLHGGVELPTADAPHQLQLPTLRQCYAEAAAWDIYIPYKG